MPDNLTPEQRSYCMSRIRGKDTKPEVRVRSALHKSGLRFHKHVKELPGTPDIVFSKARVAVFVDGEFWHGYQFTSWENKVSDFWKQKITNTQERDVRNCQKLSDMGWTVIRLWQHEIQEDFEASITRITSVIRGTKDHTTSEQKV